MLSNKFEILIEQRKAKKQKKNSSDLKRSRKFYLASTYICATAQSLYSYYIYEPTVWETSFCAFKTFPFAFRFSNEILQLNDKWMHSFHFMKNLSVENTFLLFSGDTKMSKVLIKPFDVKQVCFFQNSLKL